MVAHTSVFIVTSRRMKGGHCRTAEHKMSAVTAGKDRRPRVVIADDHPLVLQAFHSMLARDCDVVAAVPRGHEAVEAGTRLRPDGLVVHLMRLGDTTLFRSRWCCRRSTRCWRATAMLWRLCPVDTKQLRR